MSQFKMNQPSAASAPVPSRVAAPLPEANQLRKLAPESLLTLAQTLQLPANVWETREETRRLAYSTDGVARDDAIALSFEQLAELARVYGAALTCQFLLGDQVILAVGAGLTSTDVNTFRNQIKASRTVSFEIEIDKTKLLLDILGHSDDFRSVLYLFPSAFERLLRGSLGTIEAELWGDDLTAKVIVILPSRDVWIDGPLLAVIGGAAIDDPEHDPTSKRLDPERLAKIKQTRLDTLRWQENWVQGLTPAHLRVQEYRAGVGEICSSLATHVTNLVLLYIADRSFRRANNQIVASFSGEQERVEVELLPPEAGLDQKALENADTLEQLWEWVYDPQWAGDRLNLVQSSVAHDLQEADVADRWRLFRLNASRIFADLKLVWRSFIERRLDDYRSQVHDLEDYVTKTAQAYADQVSGMMKTLTDTMLAAVGALIGTFVAALFKDAFNPFIFRVGMLAYAGYVVAFPLIYVMSATIGRYSGLSKEVNTRKDRFADRLTLDRVQVIVGTLISAQQQRFILWFWITATLYVILVVLFVAGALLVPDALAHATLVPLQPTPTATPRP